MKKPDYHRLLFLDRKNAKKHTKEKRKAISKKHRINNVSHKKKESNVKKLLHNKHRAVAIDLHKDYNYAEGKTTVVISNEFGIENSNYHDSFLKIASQCIDFNTAELIFDITKSTRIWPSGITLLCSLKEWVEFGSKRTHKPHPNIASTNSKNNYVNSYLNHCGFHDYVGRTKKDTEIEYNDDEVVKIKRERDKKEVENREIELYNLIKAHSTYDSDEIELFDSIILTETFLNVTEHGIVNYDQGWWILAQYHEKHGFISLCIADNGIGIRNTLMVGPQSLDIQKQIPNISSSDGDFIKLALFANVSGAYNAPSKDSGIIFKSYSKGSRRGNGLNRIKHACISLNIKFSILSHYGYLFLDEKGNIQENGSYNKRIFGGTMYTFIIPARRM